jgi:GH25 family lysozyme M1 (1,4-beta-N-acetylmuramidase)
MVVRGFDVSGNSGTVDFRAAVGAGMRFCYARVGRGVASSGTDSLGRDINWQQYRDNARNAGLLVGGYWRFYPNVARQTQVDRFAQWLDQQPGMLPPMVDVEDMGGLGLAQLTDWSITVLDAVRVATGRTPLLYPGSRWFLANALEGWRLDRWERCLAAETGTTSWPDHSAVFWQYNLDTSVPWATGRVDLQRFACREVDLQAHTYENQLRYWIDEDGQIYGPRVVWAPLPEGDDDPQGRTRQVPRRVVIHTMWGYLGGTDAYFRSTAVGVESTFGSGGTQDGAKRDGELRQWVECDVVANANLEGDRDPPDCVSFESSDGAATRPFSAQQATTTWQGVAAVCWRYGIPAVELPDSCQGRTGIGWHRLGITGWPTSGPYRGKLPNCEAWSAINGKTCPLEPRIDQIHQTGIPTVARIVASVKTPGLQPVPPDPWETTVEPKTIPLASTDPQTFAFICPDGLVVGPLPAGAAGVGAFQNLYNGTANAVQLRVVQIGRRLAEFGSALPVDFDIDQADADQIAEAVRVALQAAPLPTPIS